MKDRDLQIIRTYESTPSITMTSIAKTFDITKQRVSSILKKYKTIHICENCYHYQEYKHCSCRDKSDIILTPNKCIDWTPKDN